MTSHLMAIELGPVVQIVAAARKTRDLWFGSFLLSEVAKAVARRVVTVCANGNQAGLVQPGAYLIVPADEQGDLMPESDFVMADEILVQVPGGVSPQVVAQAAREAAHLQWLEFADDAFQLVPTSLLDGDEWKRQTRRDLPSSTCGEVAEVYCAWVPLTDRYQDCLRRLKCLMQGRTACRNFPPAHGDDASFPKSSLDGRRRTVLHSPGKSQESARSRKLRLSRGEQLDALGVTKRLFGGRKNYPSTARLAADPWIRGVAQKAMEDFAVLVHECESLASASGNSDPILSRVETASPKQPSYPHYSPFPFEGAVLYVNRHHEFAEEAAEDLERLRDLKAALRRLTLKFGDPDRNYAILMADGDNVGLALQRCQSPEDHREFSLRLSAYAQSVRKIVEQHHGALVYAAGEDVVALLPLDACIDCADDLRTKFHDDLQDLAAVDHPLTLSVGVAIGHFLDALEDSLQAARTMLDERAKTTAGKNAMAIRYSARGGAPIECSYSWSCDPAGQIRRWEAMLLSGDLPQKIAYDIRSLAETYKRWLRFADAEQSFCRKAMQADLLRLLSAKRSDARAEIAPLIESLSTPDQIVNLANTMIVANLAAQSRSLSGKSHT